MDFYEPLIKLRDYFVLIGELNKAEMINHMLAELDNAPRTMVLTIGECDALLKYFYEVGYISHEFHSEIHKISKKIEEFLEGLDK